jgi:site-specific recombinase XerD
MRRARDEAKIGADENGERVVMYTNRHTFATEAIASGAVSDRRLADLMGHAPGSRSTQRYIHLATSDLYQAALAATRGYISPK